MRPERIELKRDPENGMLVGPDGCHYDSEKEVFHFAVLGMCGCGTPEAAYNFLRECLVFFDRRENHADRSKPWLYAEDEIAKLIAKDPKIAAHVISHFLSDKDVIEHGGSVGGSWLTPSGEQIVDAGPREDDEEDSQ